MWLTHFYTTYIGVMDLYMNSGKRTLISHSGQVIYLCLHLGPQTVLLIRVIFLLGLWMGPQFPIQVLEL